MFFQNVRFLGSRSVIQKWPNTCTVSKIACYQYECRCSPVPCIAVLVCLLLVRVQMQSGTLYRCASLLVISTSADVVRYLVSLCQFACYQYECRCSPVPCIAVLVCLLLVRVQMQSGTLYRCASLLVISTSADVVRYLVSLCQFACYQYECRCSPVPCIAVLQQFACYQYECRCSPVPCIAVLVCLLLVRVQMQSGTLYRCASLLVISTSGDVVRYLVSLCQFACYQYECRCSPVPCIAVLVCLLLVRVEMQSGTLYRCASLLVISTSADVVRYLVSLCQFACYQYEWRCSPVPCIAVLVCLLLVRVQMQSGTLYRCASLLVISTSADVVRYLVSLCQFACYQYECRCSPVPCIAVLVCLLLVRVQMQSGTLYRCASLLVISTSGDVVRYLVSLCQFACYQYECRCSPVPCIAVLVCLLLVRVEMQSGTLYRCASLLVISTSADVVRYLVSLCQFACYQYECRCSPVPCIAVLVCLLLVRVQMQSGTLYRCASLLVISTSVDVVWYLVSLCQFACYQYECRCSLVPCIAVLVCLLLVRVQMQSGTLYRCASLLVISTSADVVWYLVSLCQFACYQYECRCSLVPCIAVLVCLLLVRVQMQSGTLYRCASLLVISTSADVVWYLVSLCQFACYQYECRCSLVPCIAVLQQFACYQYECRCSPVPCIAVLVCLLLVRVEMQSGTLYRCASLLVISTSADVVWYLVSLCQFACYQYECRCSLVPCIAVLVCLLLVRVQMQSGTLYRCASLLVISTSADVVWYLVSLCQFACYQYECRCSLVPCIAVLVCLLLVRVQMQSGTLYRCASLLVISTSADVVWYLVSLCQFACYQYECRCSPVPCIAVLVCLLLVRVQMQSGTLYRCASLLVISTSADVVRYLVSLCQFACYQYECTDVVRYLVSLCQFACYQYECRCSLVPCIAVLVCLLLVRVQMQSGTLYRCASLLVISTSADVVWYLVSLCQFACYQQCRCSLVPCIAVLVCLLLVRVQMQSGTLYRCASLLVISTSTDVVRYLVSLCQFACYQYECRCSPVPCITVLVCLLLVRVQMQSGTLKSSLKGTISS